MIFPRSQRESWAPILSLFCNAVDKTRPHSQKVTQAPENTEMSIRKNTPVSLLKLTTVSRASESSFLLRRVCDH